MKTLPPLKSWLVKLLHPLLSMATDDARAGEGGGIHMEVPGVAFYQELYSFLQGHLSEP